MRSELNATLSEMDIEALHGYLKAHVTRACPAYNAGGPGARMIGRNLLVFNGLAYKKKKGSWECVDKGGIFDTIYGTVPGDHYANSHYVLMCAAMYRAGMGDSYLEDILEVEGFTLKQLAGYSNVPWGMHHDFNNYAMALAYRLIAETLSDVRSKAWRKALLFAPINRHRVGNWWGQRLLYAALIEDLSTGHRLKALALRSLFARKFRETRSVDGCFEDKRNTSRPIQYHAFSLALTLMMRKFGFGLFDDAELQESVDYLAYFSRPDGEFNYFGRGHKQIFAYSPAVYCLLSVDDVASHQVADRILALISENQLESGDFPLVTAPYPKTAKVGWYDYHRHTVYNAFFGAWLALSKLIDNPVRTEKTGGQGEIGLVSGKAPAGRSVMRIDRPGYFALVSEGYSHYGSECGLALHCLYQRSLGVITSCPGGPSDEPGGFGSIERFPHEDVNYFSPLVEIDGKWHGPGRKVCNLMLVDEIPHYEIEVGGVVISRKIAFGQRELLISDVISSVDGRGVSARISNMPINIHCKAFELQGNQIEISCETGELCRITVSTDPPIRQSLREFESFDWVEGPVQVVGIEATISGPTAVETKIVFEKFL